MTFFKKYAMLSYHESDSFLNLDRTTNKTRIKGEEMGIVTPVRGGVVGRNKLIVASIAVTLAFLIFLMIGVEVKSSILIVVVGGLTAMYFLAVPFWMEKNPGRFETLLARFGIVLQNGRLTDEQAKSLKELRFLAVPFALVTAYLALVPSWRVFGYLLVLAAMAFALTLISYWKGWTSNVWLYIHRATLFICLGAIVIFAVSIFLNESDAGGWVKQKAADYWNKPKPSPSAPQPAKPAAEAVQPKPISPAAEPQEEDEPSPAVLRITSTPPPAALHPVMEDDDKKNDVSERNRLLNLAKKALYEDVILDDEQDKGNNKKKVESPKRSSFPKLPLKAFAPKVPHWVTD